MVKCPRCGYKEQPSGNYRAHCRAEVEWYRRHGKYPERIKPDSAGVLYVIGDLSWNMNRPDKLERIESAMSAGK